VEQTYEKIIGPEYIKNFTCIGGICEDTCCAGWAIFIDEETYKKYRKVKDKTIKARLDKEIVSKRSQTAYGYAAKIKLKNGNCAFLSKQGLCDIYSTLGEKYLSDTCTLYPRTINKINNTLECALIGSCPEAARLILLNEKPIKFVELKSKEKIKSLNLQLTVHHLKPYRWQDYFLKLRECIIAILQNRIYTLEERITRLEAFMQGIEHHTTPQLFKKIPLLLESYHKSKTKSLDYDVSGDMALALELKALKDQKKIRAKRYGECLEEMLLGLGLQSKTDIGLASKKYREGYEKDYLPFISEKGYMIENYFVNYVFERCVPLDTERPLQSFERMALYYRMIRIHLIGMACTCGEITDEGVVKLIQSLSKAFDHEDETFKHILKFTKQN
jgi:lysine-N-methylase